MKLEKQVCSLELAKKLKELGVKQESLFYYNSKTEQLQKGFTSHIDEQGKMKWSISAYTVGELGMLLPKGYVSGYYENEKNWSCWPDAALKDYPEYGVNADTEANARAAMLVYLIENKLLQVQTIK